ncbi:MAG: chorismate mutase [Actinomycetota bacterium]
MSQDSAALDSLRREIDRIDDALHDLLMKRAEVVGRIAAAKPADRVPLRPSREAQVIRRLVARHAGAFPKAALVRIWREVMGALVGLQGAFSVAVFATDRCSTTAELARNHFGTACPLLPFHSPGHVLRAVSDGQAAVGVVPLPAGETGVDEAEPWWLSLTGGHGGGQVPRVVALLPFAGVDHPKGAPEPPQALALACRDHDESGDDRTLVVVETVPDVSRDRLRAVLAAGGLKVAAVPAVHRGTPWRHLVELEGFHTADDARLAAVAAARDPVERVVVVGGWAAPLSPESLR